MEKKKNEFANSFIPVSELGMSENNWTINVNDLNNALYESYCACCKLDNADTCQSSEKDRGKEKGLNTDQLAVSGRAGQYLWVALTCIFDENLHKMDEFKEMHNRHHIDAACDILESPSTNLQLAINNDPSLVNLCRAPIVININEYADYFANEEGIRIYGNFLDYLSHMSYFFSGTPFFASDVFTHIEKEDGKNVIRINPEEIKGKDVIIPQIVATRDTLDLFKKVAKFVCKNGANSAIGVFITRLKPAIDGREPKNISEKYRIKPLGERVSINFSDIMK